MKPQNQIIVVEDDPSMLQAINRLLQAAGFCPLAFPSAEALLQSGAASRAACFILDIRLPGSSGVELQQRLAAGGIDRPVIFITGSDSPATREATAACHPVAYLTKPFTARNLLTAINHALNRTIGNPDSTLPEET